MITIERIPNATHGKSPVNDVSGLDPKLQDPLKPPETPAAPTIPDNDAEIALIDQNSLRGRLADIQGTLRKNSALSSSLQNYRQLLTLLMRKREQIKEQIKELARLKNKKRDKKAQEEAIQKKINAFRQQINDLVNKANFDGNKIFTAAGQDMAISLGNDVVIDIPAKDFGVSPTDVDLSEKTGVLLEKENTKIQSLMDYDEFLQEVEKKVWSSTRVMGFELVDVLTVESDAAQRNMTMELARFTMARVLQETSHALQSQAHVTAAVAVALLLNAN